MNAAVRACVCAAAVAILGHKIQHKLHFRISNTPRGSGGQSQPVWRVCSGEDDWGGWGTVGVVDDGAAVEGGAGPGAW